jgi:predicted Rossmann fold flavoprotein
MRGPEKADVVIIGAGAAGMMTAALAGKKRRITMLEATDRIGSKIAVSGGGKCNFTHESVSAEKYRGDPVFINSVLKKFDEKAVLTWFRRRGLRPFRRAGGQFFCSRSAKEINEIFRRELLGTDIRYGFRANRVEYDGKTFIVSDSSGNRICTEELVVACGGPSYPNIGGTESGWRIARELGHRTVRPFPALVGLTLQPGQSFFKTLSGISVEVEIRVGTFLYEGRLLFAHRGISGPAVLNASLRWEKGEISIDFVPSFPLESMMEKNKNISTLLPMPKRAAKAFLKHLNVRDTSASRLSREEFARLKRLKEYRFAPAGTFGYAKAEVTRGGVAVEEIDPSTMMSRNISGLYFVGEILDVTGELGGYNFQWAFSSAAVCAGALSTSDGRSGQN